MLCIVTYNHIGNGTMDRKKQYAQSKYNNSYTAADTSFVSHARLLYGLVIVETSIHLDVFLYFSPERQYTRKQTLLYLCFGLFADCALGLQCTVDFNLCCEVRLVWIELASTRLPATIHSNKLMLMRTICIFKKKSVLIECN